MITQIKPSSLISGLMVWPLRAAVTSTIETAGSFPQDRVMLVAINQQENARTIREFLQPRDWDLTVALDPDGRIGQQFRVEAIPQTVIIGPDGKIKRLLVGANPKRGGT